MSETYAAIQRELERKEDELRLHLELVKAEGQPESMVGAVEARIIEHEMLARRVSVLAYASDWGAIVDMLEYGHAGEFYLYLLAWEAKNND